MRRVLPLASLAITLLALRLSAGLVVSGDSAEVFLVLKRVPDWAVLRAETAGAPLRRDVILDGDEQSLVYENFYVGLMRAVPALAGLVLAASLPTLCRR